MDLMDLSHVSRIARIAPQHFPCRDFSARRRSIRITRPETCSSSICMCAAECFSLLRQDEQTVVACPRGRVCRSWRFWLLEGWPGSLEVRRRNKGKP